MTRMTLGSGDASCNMPLRFWV